MSAARYGVPDGSSGRPVPDGPDSGDCRQDTRPGDGPAIVPFGPYAGLTVEEVAAIDDDYLARLVVSAVGPVELRAAAGRAVLAGAMPSSRSTRPTRRRSVSGRPATVLAALAGLLTAAGLAVLSRLPDRPAPESRNAAPPLSTTSPAMPASGAVRSARAELGHAAGSHVTATANSAPAVALDAPCGQRVAGSVTADEAVAVVGTFQAVEFRVAATKDTGRVTYLNSRVPYQGSFYVAVFPGDYDRFALPPAELFLGKCIIVQGTVELYRDTPEIVLRSPDDIRILEDRAQPSPGTAHAVP